MCSNNHWGPTFHTSTEQTNVVSAFNEANGSPTNETFRTNYFEETAMNGERCGPLCHKIDVYVTVLVVSGVILIGGLMVHVSVKTTFLGWDTYKRYESYNKKKPDVIDSRE